MGDFLFRGLYLIIELGGVIIEQLEVDRRVLGCTVLTLED